MKVTDIIRQVLDLVDAAEQAEQPAIVAQPEVDEPDALIRIRHIAGLLPDGTEGEYQNTPQERTAPVGAAFPEGDDVHYAKNPADMRTDSISLFPDWQARK